MTREEYVAALRGLADFYQKYDVPLPPGANYGDRFDIGVCADRDALARVARTVPPVEKIVNENYFILRKKLPGVQIDFFDSRDAVCTKTVIGHESVTERVPVAFEERTVQREIVKWECPPLLADQALDQAAAARDEAAIERMFR